MKRSVVVFSFFVLAAVVIGAGMLSQQRAQAQAPGGRGRGPNPELQASLARQADLEKSTPQLQITEEVLPLSVPGHTIGETVGVSKNSKGHLLSIPEPAPAGFHAAEPPPSSSSSTTN